MTDRRERFAQKFLVAGCLALAAANVLMGWTLDWPWMYAVAGLLIVSSGALVWRIRHPSTPTARFQSGEGGSD